MKVDYEELLSRTVYETIFLKLIEGFSRQLTPDIFEKEIPQIDIIAHKLTEVRMKRFS